MTEDRIAMNSDSERWEPQSTDILEAYHEARRSGNTEMKELIEGAAEVTVQAHVNRCEVENCQSCKTAAVLGIVRSS